MSKRILSVGQCSVDHGSISHYFRQQFNAEVESAESAEEAMAMAQSGPFDLILVNRQFDQDGASVVSFIKELKANATTSHLPIVLVSNYEDAQQQATAAGAAPGFGKAELGSPQLVGRLEKLLMLPADNV